jgi:membrane carboxypeptidase/penicillin-binding protein
MRAALSGREVVDFAPPETVVTINIDPTTGYIATTDCPETRDEVYIVGSEPTLLCPEHGGDPLPPLPPPVPESANELAIPEAVEVPDGTETSWDTVRKLFFPNRKSNP